MLCQLVCLDRRYQRMNCYNIREIQALLKGRFFNDFVNVHVHRLFLNDTSIGLRFRVNSIEAVKPSIFLFYRFGIYDDGYERGLTYVPAADGSLPYSFFNNNS